MEDRKGTIELLAAFLLGGVVGAGVALLFAPASGKETRQRIADYGEKVYEAGKGKVGEVVSSAKNRFKREESEA